MRLWAVYVGEGRVVHFGVGDANMTQKACHSFLRRAIPMSKGDHFLKTRVCVEHVGDIKVPPGTCIRVNNSKHGMQPSPREIVRKRCEVFLHQEFEYDLATFNSEHLATFIRYGQAVSNLIPFIKEKAQNTTQTLQMIMHQRAEAVS
ncbi:phospholipase A and acyltransferase 4-like [Takifugu rubripes]|uniref:phospholipase A and acyltransferase 4-like n=1 Tax=Takifugu rubripes TaxID=31033 RepID=UPI001145E66B|nr:phospholipase A and acyltransferase 4-like [Takifugu rubripes]